MFKLFKFHTHTPELMSLQSSVCSVLVQRLKPLFSNWHQHLCTLACKVAPPGCVRSSGLYMALILLQGWTVTGHPALHSTKEKMVHSQDEGKIKTKIWRRQFNFEKN